MYLGVEMLIGGLRGGRGFLSVRQIKRSGIVFFFYGLLPICYCETVG